MDKDAVRIIAEGLEAVANAIHNLASAVRESYLKPEDHDIRDATASQHEKKAKGQKEKGRGGRKRTTGPRKVDR